MTNPTPPPDAEKIAQIRAHVEAERQERINAGFEPDDYITVTDEYLAVLLRAFDAVMAERECRELETADLELQRECERLREECRRRKADHPRYPNTSYVFQEDVDRLLKDNAQLRERLERVESLIERFRGGRLDAVSGIKLLNDVESYLDAAREEQS